MRQKSTLIEKMRLDALTDGVFAVAMTLLVIDLKLPENFRPASAEELLHGLAELQTQFLVYVISFIVLGLRWMSLAKLSRLHETVEDRYVHWSLASSLARHLRAVRHDGGRPLRRVCARDLALLRRPRFWRRWSRCGSRL